MDGTSDGPSRATAFIPTPSAERGSDISHAASAPPGLIKAAEFIGGTAGKLVHASKAIYERMDAQHRSDMSSIRNAADQIEKKSTAFSHGVSEMSGNVVNYVRTHSSSEMMDDLEGVAKRHPAGALAIAAAAGFLFERMLLRRSC